MITNMRGKEARLGSVPSFWKWSKTMPGAEMAPPLERDDRADNVLS